MILTGPEIEREVTAGRIHIDDFDWRRVEPNSYGFKLGRELLTYETAVIDCAEEPPTRRSEIGADGVVLEPERFYLASTSEAMGSLHYATTLYASRSVASLGMWIQFSAPLGHSGAIFPWTLEVRVAQPVRVYPRMTIGKIAFWKMRGPRLRYAGKYDGSVTAVQSRLSAEFGTREVPTA